MKSEVILCGRESESRATKKPLCERVAFLLGEIVGKRLSCNRCQL